MNLKSTLFWSHLKMYEECPQKFLWTKGWDGMDVGGGDGKPKPILKRTSRHAAVMGIAIHHAIELFYNDEIYRNGKGVTELLCTLATDKFNSLCESSFIDYEEAQLTKDQMLQIVLDGVKGFIQTCKYNKLLGVYSKSEVKMVAWLDRYNSIGGILDIVIRREDSGTLLLDGKNSRIKEKVDEDQLHFYALLYRYSYRTLPSRLGFVWFRYPYEENTEETGISWVEVSPEKLQELNDRVLNAKKGMYKKKFGAKPSRDTCIFCDYKDQCGDYLEGEQLVESLKKVPTSNGFGDFSL